MKTYRLIYNVLDVVINLPLELFKSILCFLKNFFIGIVRLTLYVFSKCVREVFSPIGLPGIVYFFTSCSSEYFFCKVNMLVNSPIL